MPPPWLSAVDGGVRLQVLVQPRASRSRVLGEHGGALKIALAAPPVDGAANEALVELLADLLGVPRRQVSLVSGPSSRRKIVQVDGVDAATVEAVIK
ncbi:MAG TPA: DUF167 domain-containing protein [Myxococcaceae bacterium]|nr:DUF167 domain-containing protein [Myxococcaceae bacterium]